MRSSCLCPSCIDEEEEHLCLAAEVTFNCFALACGKRKLVFTKGNCACSLELYGDVNGFAPVVFNGNTESSLACSLILDPCINVLIGIVRNVGVCNVVALKIVFLIEGIAIVTCEEKIFANYGSRIFGLRIFRLGIFRVYRLAGECHAGKSNVCGIAICIASHSINKYNDVSNCATVGVFVISNNESYRLTCRNGNSRAAPFCVGPNIATGSTGVKNGVVAYLYSTLNVNANARIGCTVIGDGNVEGVLTCCKSCYIRANACIGVA